MHSRQTGGPVALITNADNQYLRCVSCPLTSWFAFPTFRGINQGIQNINNAIHLLPKSVRSLRGCPPRPRRVGRDLMTTTYILFLQGREQLANSPNGPKIRSWVIKRPRPLDSGCSFVGDVDVLDFKSRLLTKLKLSCVHREYKHSCCYPLSERYELALTKRHRTN